MAIFLKEKIIQITENRVLTNKGRVFESYIGTNGVAFWSLVNLPEFDEKAQNIPKGKTKFIENETTREQWNKIQLKDLK